MSGGRTAALGVSLLGALALGLWVQERWPPTGAALDCPPSRVRWSGEGASAHARCDAGGPLPSAIALAIGLQLPLNEASESDLARLPGMGPTVARALVTARPFRSWDEVNAVKGVGPARLRTLQQTTTLDP